MHIEKMTVTEASVDKPFSTRDSGHCCPDGVVAAPSPDFGRMLHSRVEALLDERDGPFAKWTKIQTLRASRARARVFFLVAIRVLAVKLHITNEVLERLATFLELRSPSAVFGALFDDLGVKLVLVAPHREETAVIFLEPSGEFVEVAAGRRGPQAQYPHAIASVAVCDR